MNLPVGEIVNHPTLIVNAFSAELIILFWNKQCELYFGIRKEDALQKPFEEVLPGVMNHPRIEYLYKALSGESVFTEGVLDKTGVPYSQLLLPLKNTAGEVTAVLNIVRPLDAESQRAGSSSIHLFSQVIF